MLIAGGFLLGSVPFSYLIPKLILKVDICEKSDDHNPGATNVFIHCGTTIGLICLAFDMLKGFLPVYTARNLFSTEHFLFSAVMAAPVLGHALGIFHHFQGGKCIATSFGEMIALLRVTRIGLILAGIYILFSTILKIPSNRKKSIASFSIFGLLSMIILTYEKRFSMGIGCVVISVIAVMRHKPALSQVHKRKDETEG